MLSYLVFPKMIKYKSDEKDGHVPKGAGVTEKADMVQVEEKAEERKEGKGSI